MYRAFLNNVVSSFQWKAPLVMACHPRQGPLAGLLYQWDTIGCLVLLHLFQLMKNPLSIEVITPRVSRKKKTVTMTLWTIYHYNIRDVDNSQKAGKIPGCQRYFPGWKSTYHLWKAATLIKINRLLYLQFRLLINTIYIPVILYIYSSSSSFGKK